MMHPRPAYVYFAQAMDGVYKIGSSYQAHGRVRAVQYEQGIRLKVAHKIRRKCRRDAYALEHALHYLFRHKHIYGEWFELTPADIDLAKRVGSMQSLSFVPINWEKIIKATNYLEQIAKGQV